MGSSWCQSHSHIAPACTAIIIRYHFPTHVPFSKEIDLNWGAILQGCSDGQIPETPSSCRWSRYGSVARRHNVDGGNRCSPERRPHCRASDMYYTRAVKQQRSFVTVHLSVILRLSYFVQWLIHNSFGRKAHYRQHRKMPQRCCKPSALVTTNPLILFLMQKSPSQDLYQNAEPRTTAACTNRPFGTNICPPPPMFNYTSNSIWAVLNKSQPVASLDLRQGVPPTALAVTHTCVVSLFLELDKYR